MRSRVVVLGSCGAWPEPGRACSGYLLEHAGTRAATRFSGPILLADEGLEIVLDRRPPL